MNGDGGNGSGLISLNPQYVTWFLSAALAVFGSYTLLAREDTSNLNDTTATHATQIAVLNFRIGQLDRDIDRLREEMRRERQ